jgi:hypothetical protein
VASTIPPVLVELQLETANIKNQMQQLNAKFDDFGSTVKKQTSFLSNFKSAAAGVFAGNVMTQGLNLLKSGLQSAIVDAQQYEKATAQLRAGIESTGNAAGLSVEGLKAQASALEELSGVDENLIMQSQAVFQTFTNIRNITGENNDIFNQASTAALDLSVKMGGDLQGATVQLGKALNDPIKGITALTRVGVVFTQAQKDTIKSLMESGDVMGAQKVILAEMNVEFGGAAKAAGDTFAGAVTRAKDKVSDFGRDLITNLQPILLSIGKAIGDLYTKYLAPLLRIIKDNKEALLLFVGVLGAAYAAFKLYGIILGVVKTAQSLYAVAQILMSGGQLASIASTNGLAASMLKLNAAMYANPIGLIVAAIALLAAGFVVAWNHSETFRKVVVTIAKGVITYVAFMIRAWGQMIEIILKVVTGPLRMWLTVMAKLPGVGKYAQQGLDFINNGIEKVGDFAESAASKVEGFKSTLDGIANKKIKIPGFGGADKPPAGEVEGELHTPGLTAEQIEAAKKSAAEKKKALSKLNADVKKNYAEMDKVIAEAQSKSFQMEEAFNERVVELNEEYEKKKLAIEKDYANKALELNAKADQDRLAVIQKGRDLLRNAFEQGAKFDLSKMFEDSDKSGAGLLQKMKEKFAAVKKLQEQAGALASAGFSQTFIQEVISQGPELGGSMADALLNATPETKGQLQELYAGLQDVSKHGLDKLAEQMSTSTSFATEELLNEYVKIGEDLDKALVRNSQELADALTKNQNELQDALFEAQSAYNEAIDALEKDTREKLAKLQEELRKTALQIKELAGAKAAAGALAGSSAAPILAGTQGLGLAAMSTGDLIINNNTTVNGTNLADPQASANAVADAMRFGSTQSLTTAQFFEESYAARLARGGGGRGMVTM